MEVDLVNQYRMSFIVTENRMPNSLAVPNHCLSNCAGPTLVEREELYTQLSFSVQSILADRYIHRREL